MKIAFVEQVSKMGGVEYSTLRLAAELDRLGREVQIICPEEGDLSHMARAQSLSVSIVPSPKFSSVSLLIGGKYLPNPLGIFTTFINVFKAAKTLEHHLNANPVDVLVSKGLLSHLYTGLAAKRCQIPCVWYMQEEVDQKRALGLFHMALIWGANRFPDKIIVDSPALLSQFEKMERYPQALTIIPNGIDPAQFRKFSAEERKTARQNLGIPQNALVIGQSGRIIPLKGHKTTLTAFAELARRETNLHLLFVGAPLFSNQSYANELKHQAQQLGIGDRVVFSGFLPDVREGLAAMDIFVHASIETDSPLGVLEAMACELPVVVSAVKGCVDMVVPGSSGLLFNPGDSEDLANQLKLIINSPQQRASLGIAGRESILANYSNAVSAHNFLSKVEEIIVNQHTTRS